MAREKKTTPPTITRMPPPCPPPRRPPPPPPLPNECLSKVKNIAILEKLQHSEYKHGLIIFHNCSHERLQFLEVPPWKTTFCYWRSLPHEHFSRAQMPPSLKNVTVAPTLLAKSLSHLVLRRLLRSKVPVDGNRPALILARAKKINVSMANAPRTKIDR